MSNRRNVTEDRFLGRLSNTDDPNACWEFQGCRRNGYGRILWDGALCSAHRVAYELFAGSVPPDLKVLHRCDNPPCCNPSHLFLGTQGDNIRDRNAKGRNPTIGSRHGRSKLTEEKVTQIRALAASGTLTHSQIARLFGVFPQRVSSIVHRKTWKHVA